MRRFNWVWPVGLGLFLFLAATLSLGSLTDIQAAAPDGCMNLIANGSFEVDSAWIRPATPQTANYTSAEAQSGIRSMRHGVAPPNWDVYSHSSAYQKVAIPYNATSAILSFYFKPFSEDNTWSAAQLAERDWSWYDPGAVIRSEKAPAEEVSAASSYGDWQEVLVLNANYQVVEVLWRQTSNGRTWYYSAFDLTRYRGQTIYVYFNVYNNGNGYRTWMYVDNVVLKTCTDGVPPTVTPRPPTPTPGPYCYELIGNGDMESNAVWYRPSTPRKANYTTQTAHTGARSMRHGIVPPTSDTYSYSSAYQSIVIPSNATSAMLSFYYKPFSEDWLWSMGGAEGAEFPDDLAARLQAAGTAGDPPPPAYDAQFALILDRYYNTLADVVRSNSSAGTWIYKTANLMPYRGKRVNVYFDVVNNGNWYRTWMFVDRVSVRVCTPGAGAHSASLQGQVRLQGRDVHDRTLVAVDGSWCGSSDPLGLFDCALSEDDPASIRVTASREGYLTAQGQWTREGAQAQSGLSVSPAVLLGGDADANDVIDLLDLVIVGSSYGTAPPADPRADLNEDGRVDIFDLVLIGSNYGLKGPTPWAGAAAALAPAKTSGQAEAQVVAADVEEVAPDASDAKDGALVTADEARSRPDGRRPGRLVRVALRLSDVTDLTAADVSYRFDPARYQVVDADPARAGVQVAPGDFLPEPRFIAANSADNTTGEIRFAGTSLRPAEAVSGSGVLAWVTFRVVEPDFDAAVAGLSLESTGSTLVGASD